MRNRTPTLKQIKTVQLIKQGYSTHRAMKEAGYSQSTLKQSYQFKKSPVVKKMMANIDKVLYDKGFTTEFIADKVMEWMGAKKVISAKVIVKKDKSTSQADGELPLADSITDDFIEVPDYDIQIKAFKEAKELFKPAEQEKGIKRKITLEEFINEGDENAS